MRVLILSLQGALVLAVVCGAAFTPKASLAKVGWSQKNKTCTTYAFASYRLIHNFGRSRSRACFRRCRAATFSSSITRLQAAGQFQLPFSLRLSFPKPQSEFSSAPHRYYDRRGPRSTRLLSSCFFFRSAVNSGARMSLPLFVVSANNTALPAELWSIRSETHTLASRTRLNFIFSSDISMRPFRRCSVPCAQIST